jgi:hypothetical protein
MGLPLRPLGGPGGGGIGLPLRDWGAGGRDGLWPAGALAAWPRGGAEPWLVAAAPSPFGPALTAGARRAPTWAWAGLRSAGTAAEAGASGTAAGRCSAGAGAGSGCWLATGRAGAGASAAGATSAGGAGGREATSAGLMVGGGGGMGRPRSGDGADFAPADDTTLAGWAGAGLPARSVVGSAGSGAFPGGDFLVEITGLGRSWDSGSGWGSSTTGLISPSRSALRRSRSACASTMLEEWLLTPMPRASQRSRTALFERPSSLASS